MLCLALQLLAQNDCLLKNRENTEWVAFGDFDEYFVYLLPQPATFKGFLCKKRLEGAAAVNYGNYELPRQCNETDLWDEKHPKFGVEYITLRAERATCNKANKEETDPNICRGRRKFFGNPRRVRKGSRSQMLLFWERERGDATKRKERRLHKTACVLGI